MNCYKLDDVELHGEILEGNDLSGVAVVGNNLIVGSDEAASVQILRADKKGYKVHHTLVLDPSGLEIDIEAVAAKGSAVYVTGSHSRVREVDKKGNLGAIALRPSRDRAFRFQLSDDGQPGPVSAMSLRAAIDGHAVLKDFAPLASKENGIDIEGLAVRKGVLYFGFRGPVLRNNWVPILVCTFDQPDAATVIYAALDGRGIRDLVAVDDGFLILAGPMGDGDSSYRLYSWDGNDGLAATNPGRTAMLAKIPEMPPGKPEGLAVLAEMGKEYELLLLCDGLAAGGATRWKLAKP